MAPACQEAFWGKFLYEQIEGLDSEYLNPLWEVVPKTPLATEVAQPLDGSPQLTFGSLGCRPLGPLPPRTTPTRTIKG